MVKTAKGKLEKDERKQYRDYSSRTNEFDEPWIKDNAAQDVHFHVTDAMAASSATFQPDSNPDLKQSKM